MIQSLLYSFVTHVGWLLFIFIAIFTVAAALAYLVQEIAKDVMVAQVTKQKRLADIDNEYEAHKNKLLQEKYELENAALIESVLISTGRHPKLSKFDVN